jgi:plastocyanin
MPSEIDLNIERQESMKSHLFVWFAAIFTAVFLLSMPFASATGDATTIQGQVTVQGIRSAGSIAVYIDSIPGKDFKPPAQHAVVDQKKMTFVPHVVVVLKGTTVDFLNSDPVGHNVYWPSISGNRKLAHNLGTWPQGQIKSFTFNDLGVAPLLCNVHTQMSGYVVVVPTPYFAVTDNQGKFAIKDVPPGRYTLKTWSEEGKAVSQEVDVSGAVTTVNLTVHR